MKKLLLSLALVLSSAFALAGSSLPPLVQNSQSFCASGCGSSSTTWVIPAGAANIRASFCGSGAAGAGGFNNAIGGAAGAGGGSTCIVDWPIQGATGATVTMVLPAAVSGGAINTAGTNGTAATVSYPVGGVTITSPAAWGGQGGVQGTVSAGGVGGAGYCTINAGTSCGAGAVMVSSAGGAAGANGGQISGSVGQVFVGSGGGGGGAPAGSGGAGRLYSVNAGNGSVVGGASTNTSQCGGGGGGGSSLFGMGGAGGAGVDGTGATGYGSGGGGGACNHAGGAGTQGIVIITWNQ